MTIGRGRYDTTNIALLAATFALSTVSVFTEKKTSAPPIRLALFKNAKLGDGLVMSLLVSSVIMATLVIDHFHLSGALHLEAVTIGLILSAGSVTAAVSQAYQPADLQIVLARAR